MALTISTKPLQVQEGCHIGTLPWFSQCFGRGLFGQPQGESGGLFEPLQLAPNYLLANAEKDGQQFAASLSATTVEQCNLPATLLAGYAGGIVHPVIGPYVLPLSPWRANDVPMVLGSNAEEARSLVDVTHVTARSFDSGIAQSLCQAAPGTF
jgi:para-nitrobenzyl esterase